MMMREVTSDAPGRVNLIGEHTDYHQGFVLPTVIPQRARVGLRMRDDRTVQVTSSGIAGSPLHFAIGSEAVTHTWVDYIQGVTVALRDIADLPGFDLHSESDVPLGSGLSSSAALVVAVLRAVRDACDLS